METPFGRKKKNKKKTKGSKPASNRSIPDQTKRRTLAIIKRKKEKKLSF